MTTEKGTVKSTVRLDGGVIKTLNKNSLVLGIVCIILGAVTFALGLYVFVNSLVAMLNDAEENPDYTVLICGVIVLMVGIFAVIAYNNAAVQADKQPKVEEDEFFNDYILSKEYINGEHISTTKTYYSWILKVKDTPAYLFLYPTKVTAYCINKASLTPEELNIVYNLITSCGRYAPQPVAPNPQGTTGAENRQAPPENKTAPAEEGGKNPQSAEPEGENKE